MRVGQTRHRSEAVSSSGRQPRGTGAQRGALLTMLIPITWSGAETSFSPPLTHSQLVNIL